MNNVLTIIGRYTNENGPEIEIKGDERSLEMLAIVMQEARNNRYKLQIPENKKPEPYQGFITSINIEVNDRPLNIQLKLSEMEISGSKEYLNTFSRNIKFVAENAKMKKINSSHTHIEYIPGDKHIEPSSVPLVVCF